MHLIEKKVIRPHHPGRAPLCGFVTYIHPSEPVLLRRGGWEVGDDIHDEFYDRISTDNGKTWGEPTPWKRSQPVEGGFLTYSENTALYLPRRDRLVTLANMQVQASLEHFSHRNSPKLSITFSPPKQLPAAEPQATDFGLKQGLYVSFCHPIEDSRGRILVPVQWQRHDVDGSIRARGFPARDDLNDVLKGVFDSGILIGEFATEGEPPRWHISKPVPCEIDQSSRGMCEGTVAELRDGRLAMVLRGSNAAWPERPGYKWFSLSDDGGQSWSAAGPWPCDDGRPLESSATGSALFRSIKNQNLYWIGNLCLDGPRPRGNWPRSPLYIAQVQEEPFALVRRSIVAIDQRAEGEPEQVQHSNFRFYQDRVTGEVVLYLTRYGERGAEGTQWLNADQYEYRLSLD